MKELFFDARKGVDEKGKPRFEFESGTVVSFKHPEILARVLNRSFQDRLKLLLISGDSESGKSTFGKLGMSLGYANRVKIYKVIANLQETGVLPSVLLPQEKRVHGFIYDPLGMSNLIEMNSKLQRVAIPAIEQEFLEFDKQTGVRVNVVEAIKHPWIVGGLRSSRLLSAVSIYVEAPLDLRIERQAGHLGLPVEEVANMVTEKDFWKDRMGNQVVKTMADLVISNVGSLEDYIKVVTSLLSVVATNTKNSRGVPSELS